MTIGSYICVPDKTIIYLINQLYNEGDENHSR